MTNLPIISNTPPSSATAAPKSPQGSSPTGNQPGGGSRRLASNQAEENISGSASFAVAGDAAAVADNAAGPKTVGAERANAQPAESFAALLAQQMGETDLLSLDAAQVAIAIKEKMPGDSAKPAIQEIQDPAAATANMPIDPATTLAAMLQQLPQEIRTPVTRDTASNMATPSTSTGKTPGIDIATLNATSRSDSLVAKPDLTKPDLTKSDLTKPDLTKFELTKPDLTKPELTKPELTKPELTKPELTKPELTKPELTKPDLVKSELVKPELVKPELMTNAALGKIDISPTAPDKQTLPDLLIRDVIKQMEYSASLTQPSQNIAQAFISPAMSAATHAVLANPSTNNAPQNIATPIDNSGWADDFSQRVSWISTQRNQVAELHLNPPDLGPLNVVLKITDNQATAQFISPHSAVRDAVENALPRLRETLADNGITLGNTTVSDQPPRDRSREEIMKQADPATQREIPTIAPQSAATAQIAPARRHNGMVDTFA